MVPIKFCSVLSVMFGATSFLFVLGASQSSSTPQGPPATKTFKARMTVNETYEPGYSNSSSPEFKTFAANFTQTVGEFLSKKLFGFQRVEVKKLANGSVVVDFDIVVQKSPNATVDIIVQALNDGNGAGLGYSFLGNVTVNATDQPSTSSTPSPMATVTASASVSPFSTSSRSASVVPSEPPTTSPPPPSSSPAASGSGSPPPSSSPSPSLLPSSSSSPPPAPSSSGSPIPSVSTSLSPPSSPLQSSSPPVSLSVSQPPSTAPSQSASALLSPPSSPSSPSATSSVAPLLTSSPSRSPSASPSPSPSLKISLSSSISTSVPSTTEQSTTPSTEDSKEFKGSGSLDDDWDSDLADSSTSKYKKLSSELKIHLTTVLKKSYKENFIGVEVNNFRKGSIKFDFTVYLKAATSVDEDTLKDVIEKGEGSSNFTISGVSVEQVAGPKPTMSTTEKPESGLEKWIIVLIVTGAVIVVLLIALLVVVQQNRRLSSMHTRNLSVLHSDKDHFVQTRMYSMSSKEMYALSGLGENAGRTNSHELTTFSPDNEGFNGTSNTGYLKIEGDKSEQDHQLVDGNKSDASDEDREKDDVRYSPGVGFI